MNHQLALARFNQTLPAVARGVRPWLPETEMEMQQRQRFRLSNPAKVNVKIVVFSFVVSPIQFEAENSATSGRA
jgi:hypothetical protein